MPQSRGGTAKGKKEKGLTREWGHLGPKALHAPVLITPFSHGLAGVWRGNDLYLETTRENQPGDFSQNWNRGDPNPAALVIRT